MSFFKGEEETIPGTRSLPDDVFEPTESDSTTGRHAMRWLLGICAIALFVRFTNLTAKPAWMDEIATAIFSLGNYSRLIATDQLISLSQILRALQLTPEATVSDVVVNLFTEDNHPPTYFVLTHWWVMGLHWLTERFTGQAIRTDAAPYVSWWALRSLSALFGTLAVPAAYWLGWVSFRDRLIALLCAALMALSPLSIHLSQEARHYSLATLLVMLSLGCFVLAVQSVLAHRAMRWRTVLMWVAINALGMSVHYFCALTYFSEALVLLAILIRQSLQGKTVWWRAHWVRVYAAAAGTAVSLFAWLPILLHFYGSPQTTYIVSESRGVRFWIAPIVQSFVGWLYVLMSPITNGFTWQMVVVIVVTSVFIVLVYSPWMGFYLARSLKFQWQNPQRQPGLLAIGGFFIAANLTFLVICYGLGFDITRGHRYSFAFYPSIVILVGAGLAPFWLSSQSEKRSEPSNRSKLVDSFSRVNIPLFNRSLSGRTFVFTLLLLSFLGSQTIVFDATHLKYYRPTRFVDFMQAESSYPAILAAQAVVGDQPSVIGTEIVSVALEIQQQLERKAPSQAALGQGEWVSIPQFILLEENVVTQNDPTAQLVLLLETVPQPFDFWMLGESPNLSQIGCSLPKQGYNGSFAHSHYVCK